jgi:glutamine synthetase adenylyltransferase
MGEEFEGFMNIRKRIASEKIKPGATDIKFGPGGLIEIEFICQALAMEYPEALKQREPFTMAILKMAKAQKWLGGKDLRKLEKAYMVYRSLEDTLRMNREQALDVIPKSNKQLIRRLAHSVEVADISPDDLVGYLKEMMGTTQAVYQDFFQSLINERSGATP